MRTPLSAMGLVLFGSLLGSIGAAFLKAGAVALTRHWTSLAYNWKLVLGVAMYLLSSVFFIMGISRGELSVLYPMVSLGYICTLVWSRIFFHEKITSTKLAGVGLILAGIVMMNFGNR